MWKKKTINNVKKVYAIFNSFGNHYLKENNDKFFLKSLIVSNLVQLILVTSDWTYFEKLAVISVFILFQKKVVMVGIISKKIENI